jgi:ribosomal protein S12 methylthiotransferase
MKEQVPERAKLERRRRLMDAQREVASRVWARWVGRTVDVLVDGPSPNRKGLWVGRIAQQGYEVDGITHVRGGDGIAAPAPGTFARVRITKTRQYDLEGEVVA